jgi:hypothetical protein
LAKRLMSIGYTELFHRPTDHSARALSSGADSIRKLERLALDPEMPTLARFLGAEILFDYMPGFPPPSARPDLASVYATALAANFTQIANPWGLPGELDGRVGRHVIELGSDAIASFSRLLADGTPIIYGGSKDATVGNSYRYRVRDVAAFLISQVSEIGFGVAHDPAVRDRDIERMGRMLGLPSVRAEEGGSANGKTV